MISLQNCLADELGRSATPATVVPSSEYADITSPLVVSRPSSPSSSKLINNHDSSVPCCSKDYSNEYLPHNAGVKKRPPIYISDRNSIESSDSFPEIGTENKYPVKNTYAQKNAREQRSSFLKHSPESRTDISDVPTEISVNIEAHNEAESNKIAVDQMYRTSSITASLSSSEEFFDVPTEITARTDVHNDAQTSNLAVEIQPGINSETSSNVSAEFLDAPSEIVLSTEPYNDSLSTRLAVEQRSRTNSESSSAELMNDVSLVITNETLLGNGDIPSNSNVGEDNKDSSLNGSKLSQLIANMNGAESNITRKMNGTESNITRKMNGAESNITRNMNGAESNITRNMNGAESNITRKMNGAESNITRPHSPDSIGSYYSVGGPSADSDDKLLPESYKSAISSVSFSNQTYECYTAATDMIEGYRSGSTKSVPITIKNTEENKRSSMEGPTDNLEGDEKISSLNSETTLKLHDEPRVPLHGVVPITSSLIDLLIECFRLIAFSSKIAVLVLPAQDQDTLYDMKLKVLQELAGVRII